MTFDPCKTPRSHLSDHIDGQPLPLGVRLLVGCHLTICPPCRRLHQSLRATRDALSALRDAPVEGDETPSAGV